MSALFRRVASNIIQQLNAVHVYTLLATVIFRRVFDTNASFSLFGRHKEHHEESLASLKLFKLLYLVLLPRRDIYVLTLNNYTWHTVRFAFSNVQITREMQTSLIYILFLPLLLPLLQQINNFCISRVFFVLILIPAILSVV